MRRERTSISPTAEIIAEVRAGNIVVLVDDEDRENEGDLVFAADFVTPEKVNFLATHGRGLICMPLTAAHAERLGLKPMVSENRSRHGTNFTVSIEAAEGIATGISAHDRALTIRVAAAAGAAASDIVQPGHVFPLIAQDGGVLVRAGHTEACCDLARLAGLMPAAVLCEIMRTDGTMARLSDLMDFAAEREVDTPWGKFRLVSFRDRALGSIHLALVHGNVRAQDETLVRVHEPLSVLDLLDAAPGTHSWGVGEALAAIRAAGAGVMVLMNCSQSSETLQAQLAAQLSGQRPARQGRSVELRTYGIGAQILRDLGVGKMRLLAAPRKMPSMAGFGLEVTGYVTGGVPGPAGRT